MTRWFSFLRTGRTSLREARRPASSGQWRYRPSLDALEDRVVMSTTIAAPPIAALAAAAAPAAQAAAPIVPIVINNVTNTATGLIANANIGNQALQIPLDLTVPAGQDPASTTQILNLHLGPIDLNVLGLEIKTSEICLNIEAEAGAGNLLGNLLTDIAHLLDTGTPLGDVLGGLTSTQLGTLTSGLTDLLNGAFGQLTSPTTLTGDNGSMSVHSTGSTNILHLEVGPLDLNLLGLHVMLDDCHGGPVTVDIIAHQGPGNLLGNLLGGLAHLLDSHTHGNGLLNKLDKIADRIADLL